VEQVVVRVDDRQFGVEDGLVAADPQLSSVDLGVVQRGHAGHSRRMPACLITFAQRSVSSRRKRSRSAGAPGCMSMPRDTSLACTSGAFMASPKAVFSRVTTAAGVPAGARKAYHGLTSRVG